MSLENRVGKFDALTFGTFIRDEFAQLLSRKQSSIERLRELPYFAQYEKKVKQLPPEELLREQGRLDKQSTRWDIISGFVSYGTIIVFLGAGAIHPEATRNEAYMFAWGMMAGGVASMVSCCRYWDIEAKRRILQ